MPVFKAVKNEVNGIEACILLMATSPLNNLGPALAAMSNGRANYLGHAGLEALENKNCHYHLSRQLNIMIRVIAGPIVSKLAVARSISMQPGPTVPRIIN